jgi:LuxR family maltose regulon positive regulatory protein
MTASLTLLAPPDPWAGRPSLARGVVARPQLVAALTAAEGGCVAVLRAPAGYGKTTLLCQWEASDPRPFAWLTIDARCDEDPGLIAGRLVELLGGRPPGEPFVLVLDDAHALRTREARRVLQGVVTDLPPVAALALATRGDTPVPLGRLRAQNRVVELDARGLAMTRKETAAFLALGGRRSAPGELEALTGLTEGWPAGLSLALLALADGRHPSQISGADPLYADYLDDEVLGALSEDDRTFLRRTSVLDTLSGPDCDAVLGTTGSAAVLARLAGENVPLVPVDRRGERLRPHRLLASALAAELRRAEPDDVDGLHRRASGWYRRAGDLDGALRHALAGGDLPRAATLVYAGASRAVAHGDVRAVERRLERFTEHQLTTTPQLALAAAIAHLGAGRGDLVSHWTSVAELARPASPDVAAGVAALRAALGHDGLEAVTRDAARAVERGDRDDVCAGLAHFVAGAAHHLLGDRATAARELEAGARRAAVSAPALHALCRAQLGVLAIERDDRSEATELLTRARAQIDRHGLQDLPVCALVHAAAAVVRAHDGRVQDARADLAQATRLQEQLADVAPWYDGELRILCAWAAWRLCDVPDALARLRDCERYVRRSPEAVVLTEWLERAHEQLAEATAPAARPPASLTAAELRILRFLPTHLTFREIAERTFVSANTVKTQANAVYRKLDVSSRSEAVTRARSLGVLDPA